MDHICQRFTAINVHRRLLPVLGPPTVWQMDQQEHTSVPFQNLDQYPVSYSVPMHYSGCCKLVKSLDALHNIFCYVLSWNAFPLKIQPSPSFECFLEVLYSVLRHFYLEHILWLQMEERFHSQQFLYLMMELGSNNVISRSYFIVTITSGNILTKLCRSFLFFSGH